MLHIILSLLLLLAFAAFVNAADFDQADGFLISLWPTEPGLSVLFDNVRNLFSHSPTTPCEPTDTGTNLPTDPAQHAYSSIEHSEDLTRDAVTGSASFAADDVVLAGAHFAGHSQPPRQDNQDLKELSSLGLENLHESSVNAHSRRALLSAWQGEPANVGTQQGLPSPPPTRSLHNGSQVQEHVETRPNHPTFPMTPPGASLYGSEASVFMGTASSSSGRAQIAQGMSRSGSQPGNRFRRHARASGGPILHCCPKDLRLMMFDTKNELHHHRRYDVPDSERPHQCPVFACPKGFVSPNERDRHLSTHGIVRIPKVYCPWQDCKGQVEGFSRKDNFGRHIRKVHHGLLPPQSDGLPA